MEFSSFSSPESPSAGSPARSSERSPERSSSESKDEDGTKSKDKKKKSTASAAALAEIATNNSLKREQAEQRERRTSKKESYWRKIIGNSDGEGQSPDVALFGIPKPDEIANPVPKSPETAPAPDSGAPSTEMSSDAAAVPTVEQAGEADVEQSSAEQNSAEQAELKQAARDFAEIQSQAADGILHELPLDASDTPAAAEVAADLALLRTMQDNLRVGSPQSAAEVIDSAASLTAERIDRLAASAAETDHEPSAHETDSESFVHEATAELPPLLVHETGPALPLAETVPPPPILPPLPPGTPPSGGAFPPPEWRRTPDATPVFTPTYVEAAPAVVPAAQALRAEQAAAGRGLLTGGVVGYFIGRRRGKKLGRAEADKKAAPIRRNLEQQVKNLQESIVVKENHIKAVAREKMQSISRTSERKQFVENILQSDAATPAAESALPSKPKVEAAVVIPAAAAVAELYVRSRGAEHSPAAGEFIINNRRPAVEAAAATLQTRPSLEAVTVAPIETPAPSVRTAEQARVIPFNKKAEDFSRDEVRATAEKIIVQGVSLKEMMQLGSLDERAVRRVIAEFLEGGDVSAVVSREIQERELKYERDPQMRQPTAGSSSSSAVSGGVAGAVLASTGSGNTNDDESATAASTASTAYQGPRPTPDASTLSAIRNKQIATITLTTVLIVVVVAVLLWATG